MLILSVIHHFLILTLFIPCMTLAGHIFLDAFWTCNASVLLHPLHELRPLCCMIEQNDCQKHCGCKESYTMYVLSMNREQDWKVSGHCLISVVSSRNILLRIMHHIVYPIAS